MLAQFLSAMADNVLFVAAVALLKSGSGGASLLPLVQATFVLAFIVFAPWVGPFADAYPKGRVMFRATLVKLLGAGLMLGGLNPLAGYAIVGLGAAAYSPAKYGILSQLVGADTLIKANGLLEGSTIAAILLGVLAGGWLADHSPLLAVQVVAGLYIAAAAANLLIPRLVPSKPLQAGELAQVLPQFVRDTKTLLRLPDARFSLLGTSLFWGMGASLRLLLFAWVPVALGLLDNQTPATLMGLVSVGIVAGAALAATTVGMHQTHRAMFGGLVIGPLLWLLSPMHSLAGAAAVLLGLGAAGGYFAIPLNALLQACGRQSVGTGRALAVQNFFENLAMLLMAGLYFLAIKAGLTPGAALLGFGLLMLVGMLAIGWRRLRQPQVLVRFAAWDADRAALAAIRRAVFINEQGVPEALEWDEHDAHALHLLAFDARGRAVGCARLLPDGHVGRMAVLADARGSGAGSRLLEAAQDAARARGLRTLLLSAQSHAAGFYARHGFAEAGDAYLEAGILHIAMKKELG